MRWSFLIVLLFLASCAPISRETASSLRASPPLVALRLKPPPAPLPPIVDIASSAPASHQRGPAIVPWQPTVTFPTEVTPWKRDPPPPEAGPMFDPTALAASVLLGGMERAGYARAGTMECARAAGCEKPDLVAEVALSRLAFDIDATGDFQRYTLRLFEMDATFRHPTGEPAFELHCSRTVQAEPKDGRAVAEAAQAALDASALQCGVEFFDQVDRALSDAGANRPD